MAKKNTFNHRRRIVSWQPVKIKSLYPGMIVQFEYKGENLSDTKPLLLTLWNDYSNSQLHGINLNYLSEAKIKFMFQRIIYHIEIF